MTLDEYLQQIRQELMDADGLIYPAETLTTALRRALFVYNRACPQSACETVQVNEDGRSAGLDDLTGLVDVLEVMDGETEVRRWIQYSDSSSASLLLRDEFAPGAGLRVRFTRPHTISGLDGATSTSVPGLDEILLVGGAAGYAACGRSGRRAQGFDPLPASRQELQAWGQAALDEFRAGVIARRSRAGAVAIWG